MNSLWVAASVTQRLITSLQNIVTEYQGQLPDTAKNGESVRVVRYADDERTPLVIEYTRIDDEGTTWVRQHDLEKGETSLRQIPEDR